MSAARANIAVLHGKLLTSDDGARLSYWLAACVMTTLVLTCASLFIGTSSLETSLGWLLSPDAQSSVILWQIRLPRTVGAWAAGALLGLAGAIAQGLFRNPLAEPYLLGTASGAALGVTLYSGKLMVRPLASRSVFLTRRRFAPLRCRATRICGWRCRIRPRSPV